MSKEKRIRPPQPGLLETLVASYMALGHDITASSVMAENAKVERRLGAGVIDAFGEIAAKIGCDPSELRVDHDPMLRVRAYKPRKGRSVASWYSPHAHDPSYLKIRPQGVEHAGSHHTKTYIRGEHGQYSDVVLAKRERRREKARRAGKPSEKRSFCKAKFAKGARKMRSANRWPPKGSRKMNWKAAR